MLVFSREVLEWMLDLRDVLVFIQRVMAFFFKYIFAGL